MSGATVSAALLGLLFVCFTTAPPVQEDVEISSFHINSTVTSRYAITVITSRVKNQHTDSKEIHFEVKIPKNAFISKFRMTIEGKTYDGVVKEKEAAQQQYSDAVARGESAGVVSSVGRTLEEFKTSVTVAALSKVTFELTYEELLQRRHGKYDLLIHTQPMQPVADFKIDVSIKENPGISFLEVKGDLNSGELTNAVTTARSGKEAWIHFYPTSDQQTTCSSCTENGLNGDLIITYDVERTNPNGDIQIMNNYFVHCFAPSNLIQTPKNVVFIIDRSGSMSGRKIQQTRSALDQILGDLDRDDHFGLILFDSRVDVWKPELIQATSSNVNLAKQFVKTIQDRGATNINSAVLMGVEMLNKHRREGSASILILLTDGDPNEGESNPDRIRVNVKEAIGKKMSLYCLGFGFDVNFDFLEKMALENNGFARRIYDDSDASDQLQGFYDEVATLLLSDLELLYEGASNLTETAYSMYYNGSEIIVAGEITNNSLESFKVEVVAFSRSNKVTYEEEVSLADLPDVEPQHENVTQRVWAYLKVKQLLKKELTLTGAEKEAAKKEALDLSLQYSFVTPLTSMVVTKPQKSDTQVAHKPEEGGVRGEGGRGGHGHVLPMVPYGGGGGGVLYGQAVPMVPNGGGGGSRLVAGGGYAGGITHGSSGSAVSRDFSSASIVQEQVISGLLGPPGQPGLSAHPVISGLPEIVQQQVISGLLGPTGQPGLSAHLDYLVDYGSPPQSRPTRISSTTSNPRPTAAVKSVRFLISSSGQSKPLCFDVPSASKLLLLKDLSSEFSMSGKLTQSGTGFDQIALHYKTDHHLSVSTADIIFSDGQNTFMLLWGQELTVHQADGVSVILRDSELDVTLGGVRVVILLHKEGGNVFLWPAVRQQPKHDSLQGILAKTSLQYEELPGLIIKISDQEEAASLSAAKDYRLSSAPIVGCWVVRLQFALQGELSDFTLAQL
ncbi:inter-alpha-trypsin inhibitor heavy chain H3 isoform X4 [Astyanax mexicanus]|uniref:inter-alpha-trypsin inhibitor heavy chain H3 isoform X3 n=1 Tax=Astyanax mexicanus TaxID=7994 RepID=UPI0020CAA752|nr:inter-alpha-trypsin inhibitor heavy chain H3 isoform X3 [Astyanax mexicanus]XP_049327490.1 inter-alpha-trypsin inhibitor heavy chain H3 isoform X4 [Astyanax mexicanus]